VEREDDDEAIEEADLTLGEKLFLAIFAWVQELKIKSLGTCLFAESLLTIFLNDKLDSEIFIFKLEKLSQALFDAYIG